MTQEEEKELYKRNHLIKDLCSRLPYEVKAYVKNWSNVDRKYYEDIYDVKSVFPSLNEVHVQSKSGSLDVLLGYYDYDIKPYLFPLSSMTEEQKQEYSYIVNYLSPDDTDNWKEGEFVYVEQMSQLMHFFYKNHFDYRGLIPMGLANDATGLNIY